MSTRNMIPQRSMRIRPTQERRERMLRSVQMFFEQRLDIDPSPLGAEQVIYFFVKELGAPVYNQAIQDARAFVQGRLDDLEGEFYEPDEPLSR